MEIILLDDGKGIPHYEVEAVATDSVLCSFVGEIKPTVLSITDGERSVRIPVKSGVCEIQLEPFIGKNVKFIASTKGKIWSCGGFRIERTRDGGVGIKSLTDYAEMFKKCISEITHLKQSIKGLKEVVDEIRGNGTNKTYNIV